MCSCANWPAQAPRTAARARLLAEQTIGSSSLKSKHERLGQPLAALGYIGGQALECVYLPFGMTGTLISIAWRLAYINGLVLVDALSSCAAVS